MKDDSIESTLRKCDVINLQAVLVFHFITSGPQMVLFQSWMLTKEEVRGMVNLSFATFGDITFF